MGVFRGIVVMSYVFFKRCGDTFDDDESMKSFSYYFPPLLSTPYLCT